MRHREAPADLAGSHTRCGQTLRNFGQWRQKNILSESQKSASRSQPCAAIQAVYQEFDFMSAKDLVLFKANKWHIHTWVFAFFF